MRQRKNDVTSTDGRHFVGLDHARALAVFLVFGYHMLEAAREVGATLPDQHTFIPYSLLNQGHTGVALFMTLSGYLFARLTEGRMIAIGAFLRNRALRLFPLLFLVLLTSFSLEGLGLMDILKRLVLGLIYPIWPNGTWSIVVEIHFYLIFPFLLIMTRRSPWPLLAVVACAILFRASVFLETPERVHALAYWTIFGRIDQFVLGMLLARTGLGLRGRHHFAAIIALCFIVTINAFDRMGGIHRPEDLASLWIWWPTLEGLSFALLIAWYDQSFKMPDSGISRMIAKVGQWSYSIYLLHFFFVWRFVEWVDQALFPVDRFDQVFGLTLIGFALILVPAALSYRFIESPFLKRRIKYLGDLATAPEATASPGLAGIAHSR